jgi:hypothetical protein
MQARKNRGMAKHRIRLFSRVIIFALILISMKPAQAFAFDSNHPAPMGLEVFRANYNGLDQTAIWSTNYESNTVTEVYYDNLGKKTVGRLTIPTGRGPFAVNNIFGGTSTANFQDGTLTQYFVSVENGLAIDTQTVDAGLHPSALNHSGYFNGEYGTDTFYVSDPSGKISRIVESDQGAIESSTVINFNEPVVLPKRQLSSDGRFFNWMGFNSNQMFACNPIDCQNSPTMVDDLNLVDWCYWFDDNSYETFCKDGGLNGLLRTDIGIQFHPVGFQFLPYDAVVIIEEVTAFNRAPKQYIIYQYSHEIIFGFDGPFDAPHLDPLSTQRFAVSLDTGTTYLITGADSIIRIQHTQNGIETSTIQTDPGIAAITFDDYSGDLFVGNSFLNTVTEYDSIGSIVNEFSMSPDFKLSASSESATAGRPISGYAINSLSESAYDFTITPAIENGLTFSSSTGLISGTPLSSAASKTYTITGKKLTAGEVPGDYTAYYASATFTISVASAPTPPAPTPPAPTPPAPTPPAPTPPVQIIPTPDPVQQSKITDISPSTTTAGNATPVVISGTFIEKISSIQINGVALPSGSWVQSSATVSFSMPSRAPGVYQIQIYNGSSPVLKPITFTYTASVVVATPIPTPITKPKVTYIRCVKPGHGTRIAYGVNPSCPAGYAKK